MVSVVTYYHGFTDLQTLFCFIHFIIFYWFPSFNMGFEQDNLEMEEGTLEVGMGKSMIRISCFCFGIF